MDIESLSPCTNPATDRIPKQMLSNVHFSIILPSTLGILIDYFP
jgi:hypothetical protein